MSVGHDFRADSPGNIRIAGSNDPALELLASSVRKLFPRLTVLAANVGSRRGLAMLQRGGTHISGMHIFDPADERIQHPLPPKDGPFAEARRGEFRLARPGDPGRRRQSARHIGHRGPGATGGQVHQPAAGRRERGFFSTITSGASISAGTGYGVTTIT